MSKLEALYTEFKEHVRKEDLSLDEAALSVGPRILDLFHADPMCIDLRRIRAVSFSKGKIAEGDIGPAPHLIIVRGTNAQESPVVCFTEGSTIWLPFIEMAHDKVETSSLRWKDDNPRGGRGKTSFLDTITSSGK